MRTLVSWTGGWIAGCGGSLCRSGFIWDSGPSAAAQVVGGLGLLAGAALLVAVALRAETERPREIMRRIAVCCDGDGPDDLKLEFVRRHVRAAALGDEHQASAKSRFGSPPGESGA